MRDLLLSNALYGVPKIELIDFDGDLVEDVSDRFIVEGSYIRRDSTRRIDGTARFNFADVEGFDFGRNLLRVSLTLTDRAGRAGSRLWRLGNWVMQPPDIALEARVIQVDALDTVSLLSTRLEAEISITPGTNISSAITSVLRAHGIRGLSGVVDEQGDPLEIGRELSTYANANVTDNITYLDFINSLLQAVGYVGMFTDRFGRLSSYPRTPLKLLRPRWDFDFTRDKGSGIVPPTKRLGIKEQIPNVWIGEALSADQPGDEERIKLVLGPGSMSEFSVDAQGGRRNVRVVKLQVGSSEDLLRALEVIQAEDLTRSDRLEVHCGPVPLLWQADPVRANIAPLDIVDRIAICREWQLEFDIANRKSMYLLDLAPAGFQDS